MRDDKQANALFLEILTSRHDPETVLRRMNEAGVLGKFVPAFGKIVAMMQFNMYHHYTVDEHLLRCIGMLEEIEHGGKDTPLANELIQKILPANRKVLYVALFLHDIAKGRIEDHSIAGARVARRFCPRLGFSAADTETVAWLIENHLVMSSVAQSRDLSDRKTDREFRRRGAIGGAAEAADHPHHRRHPRRRPRRVERLEGAADAHALLRDRAGAHRRLLGNQPRPARGAWRRPNSATRCRNWPKEDLDAYIAKLYPAYWLKVDLPHKLEHARLVAQADRRRQDACHPHQFRRRRGDRTHRAGARSSRGCCRSSPAPAPWPAPTSSTRRSPPPPTAARSTPFRCTREFERDEDEAAARRPHRRFDREGAARRTAPARRRRQARRPPKGRIKAFALEPSVIINNQWSHRYTMVEVTGLDRTGLLYELTATLSKLNLNIISAHVATFGERVVDVFYVTDLMGAQITAPTRQAAIKRALIALFAEPAAEGKSGKG